MTGTRDCLCQLKMCLITERELITPPLNGLILPGITRDSILHLAREWRQFKVTERPLTMPEIKKALHQGRVSSQMLFKLILC